MKTKNLICSVIFLGLVTGCMSEKQERAGKQAKLQAEAKVSRADAEKTALAQAPGGTVKEAELEKEKGKLVWSFDIATPDSKDITEVTVDAISGEFVSVEKETPGKEAKEKDEDEKK
jgi:uncharacterized membrane protein YkoI